MRRCRSGKLARRAWLEALPSDYEHLAPALKVRAAARGSRRSERGATEPARRGGRHSAAPRQFRLRGPVSGTGAL